MNSTKKTWTQLVAVAAAAACAVSATIAGMTINHADAAAGDIAYLRAHDNNWAIGATNDSFGNSVVMTGDGSYSLTVTNNSTYAASAWDEGEMALVLQEDWLEEGSAYTDRVTIDSIVFPDATYENVAYTMGTNSYPEYVVGNEKEYLHSAVLAIDTSIITDGTVDAGESVTVNFTIGEASAETTTTTTTTTTEEGTTTTTTLGEGETTTTTTTTAVDTSEEETTTTTTTKAAATTTTKVTTTTTNATTTTARTSVLTPAKQTEEGDDGNINAFIEFDPDGAESATVYYKVLSNDTNTSGAIGTWNGAWTQDEWTDLAVPTDGIVIREYTIPEDVGETVKVMVFWPGATNVQFQKVVLHYGEQTEPVTPPVESDLEFTKYKIADEANGKLDMLNKAYIIVTAKGDAGDKLSFGIYSGDPTKDKYYLDENIEENIPASGLVVKEYELRGAYDATYGFYYNGGNSTVDVNIRTFYEGDASMNGKVNASDVRAIVKYMISDEKTNAQDVLCDYDDDGSVGIKDVIALSKFIMSNSSQKTSVVSY